ncbi:DUF559 domain-containing protein [Gordonia soli]|uniref:DUF559 domain-containing protein n=1 Tax=Gordonia soli NBRC 108243 TaxID=1223545 RepID=M0QHS4_9ACTN|nr:DUF559 domain-containing protein [Gordonia soli]GAC67989.1 hypothetical protein GS4_11_02600 [Gordonia soli NBRC 108243]
MDLTDIRIRSASPLFRSSVRPDSRRRTSADWSPPEPESTAVDDVATVLRHALKCLDEGIVVVCDSILHLGLLDEIALSDAIATAPRRIRRLLARCDPAAESGTESMVRFRLQTMGIRVRAQVVIPGVGRVDMLVGDRLIIEIDSYEHHDRSPQQRERDRRRDEAAAQLGYLTLRFSYQRVVGEWPAARHSVLAVVRRRDHLKMRADGVMDAV